MTVRPFVRTEACQCKIFLAGMSLNGVFFNPEIQNFGLKTNAIGVIYRGRDSPAPCFVISKTMLFQLISVRVITELYYKSLYGLFLDLVCRVSYYK